MENSTNIDYVTMTSSSPFVLQEWISTILLTALLSLICLVSLVGNILVVVAVRVERKLHSYTNYFIVSLACADLLIALLVMPLAIIYQVRNFVHSEKLFFFLNTQIFLSDRKHPVATYFWASASNICFVFFNAINYQDRKFVL